MGIQHEPGQPTPRQLDSQALAALAHPLRIRIFQSLTHYGSATATQLGERLGESSGSTSYHLRQLERFGFVETDPDRGNGRDRWWRRVEGGVAFCPPDPDEDPAGHATARFVIDELHRARWERQRVFTASIEDWSDEWTEASLDHAGNMMLSAAETAEMADELRAVVERWRARTAGRTLSDDTEQVELQMTMFPLPRHPQRPPASA